MAEKVSKNLSIKKITKKSQQPKKVLKKKVNIDNKLAEIYLEKDIDLENSQELESALKLCNKKVEDKILSSNNPTNIYKLCATNKSIYKICSQSKDIQDKFFLWNYDTLRLEDFQNLIFGEDKGPIKDADPYLREAQEDVFIKGYKNVLLETLRNTYNIEIPSWKIWSINYYLRSIINLDLNLLKDKKKFKEFLLKKKRYIKNRFIPKQNWWEFKTKIIIPKEIEEEFMDYLYKFSLEFYNEYIELVKDQFKDSSDLEKQFIDYVLENYYYRYFEWVRKEHLALPENRKKAGIKLPAPELDTGEIEAFRYQGVAKRESFPFIDINLGENTYSTIDGSNSFFNNFYNILKNSGKSWDQSPYGWSRYDIAKAIDKSNLPIDKKQLHNIENTKWRGGKNNKLYSGDYPNKPVIYILTLYRILKSMGREMEVLAASQELVAENDWRELEKVYRKSCYDLENQMNLGQLRGLARSLGISVNKGMNKQELCQQISMVLLGQESGINLAQILKSLQD